MNLKDLEYLTALDEYRNISKAADHLYITQPALSRFLINLEKEAGIRLFNKTSRNLIPTPAGELYIRFARQTLENRERLSEEVSRFSSAGVIRIGIPLNLSPVLVQAIIRFRQLEPEIRIELYEDVYTGLSSAIHNGKLDLVFVGSQEPAKKFGMTRIFDETIMVCIPRSLGISLKQNNGTPYIDLEDLDSVPVIMPLENEAFNRTISRLAKEKGTDLKDRFYTRNHTMAFQLAAEGYGASFIVMPEHHTENNVYKDALARGDFFLCQLSKEPIVIPVYAVYNDLDPDPRILSFLRILKDSWDR